MKGFIIMKEKATFDITINFNEGGIDLDYDFPPNKYHEDFQGFALEVIIDQIFDLLTLQQKCEFDFEEAPAVPVGVNEIIVKVCYPDDFSPRNLMQIDVLTETLNSLPKIELAVFYLSKILETFNIPTLSDMEPDRVEVILASLELTEEQIEELLKNIDIDDGDDGDDEGCCCGC
jgi:hypothetical protein